MEKIKPDNTYNDRDLSWLSFNERVLMEAERATVPLLERFRFLAIYSSNLDEFYRVRMPVIRAFHGDSSVTDQSTYKHLIKSITDTIIRQSKRFGAIIEKGVVPELRRYKVHLLYNETIPEFLMPYLQEYFFQKVAAFLQVVNISHNTVFFPENNKLYLAVSTVNTSNTKLSIVTIPSDVLPRFYSVSFKGVEYIVFLDDIVKVNVQRIFTEDTVEGCHAFKITRDAELDLEDEFEGNLARKIEKKLRQRDRGLATRFLYDPAMPQNTLVALASQLNLQSANYIPGGTYHNLKDFMSLPLKDKRLQYEQWPEIKSTITHDSLFEEIRTRDIVVHTPYHGYQTVLRFFNEAALDLSVQRIYVTVYRIAADSQIANALMSAARNGKKVTVFVELKARFDEANNIRWSKEMKEAGVRIIESIPGLKVHAKLALVKRKRGNKSEMIGLFSTGNFNESTARFYTDHILLTSHRAMLKEVESVFKVLKKRKRKIDSVNLKLKHLLVGQFNLQQRFLGLIDQEISHAKKGNPAAITIKFNNLEERVMIDKLYEASQAGVQITLLVRGICCLAAGVKGMSESIIVKRTIDRYLEHGRIFIFHNNNTPIVYLGSADWMIRNIYRRIEVCFPIYQADIKAELITMISMQIKDNVQSVWVDQDGNNQLPVATKGKKAFRSQIELGRFLLSKSTTK